MKRQIGMKRHCGMAPRSNVCATIGFLALAGLGLLTMACAPTSETSALEEAPGAESKGQSLKADSTAIASLLDTQVAAWNRGDVPAFMGGYWKSPELRFASGGSVNRGWQVTLDRYLARYPDDAAMGTLRFEEREVSVLGPRHALVFGRWILDRANDQPQGLFTLLLERFEEPEQEGEYRAAHGWRVVADHTSSQ